MKNERYMPCSSWRGPGLAGALFRLRAMLCGDETNGMSIAAILCFLLSGSFCGIGRTGEVRGDERP